MTVDTYTKSGSKSTTATNLDKKVFGVEVKNHLLLKEAYLAYLSNTRDNLAKTKKRGEVRGGGQKPWRQKGTGRARFGSSRNPIWTGGGVAFGPSGNENYKSRLSAKVRRQALRQALSLSATEGRIKVIDKLDLASGKTKDAATLIKKLKIERGVLLVTDELNPKLIQAVRNAPTINLTTAANLSVYRVLNADAIVISKPALVRLGERLSDQASDTALKSPSGVNK